MEGSTSGRMTVVAVLLATVLAVAGVGAQDPPVVATQEGRISGILEESTKGKVFYSYYGVPFAKPPLGELRLKNPVAAEPWEGVRDGSTMPEMCLQVPFGDALGGKRPPPEGLSGSEDCLYLNVFTPALPDEAAGLPVMVWIYGGGYFSGGAKEYLPHVLLNHDIVLVVLQYRVGLMGFMSTEDSVIPGNFGLRDQRLALHWVQRNIHNFGGDKTRVTIFGQSAGGASVHYHILSPGSDGLFSRAIMHSGSALCPWAQTRRHGSHAQYVATSLGCPIQEGSEAFLACLQAVDARQLAALGQDLFSWSILPMTLGPRVDGDFVPEEPGQLVREGRYKKVDLLIGTTPDEGAVFAKSMLVNKELVSALVTNFSAIAPVTLQCHADNADPPSLARRVYRRYLGESKPDPVAHSEQINRMFTDRQTAVNVELVALHHAKDPTGGRTYRYILAHRGELSVCDFLPTEIGRHWICHADDLYYLFRGGPLLQSDQQPPERPRDLRRQEDLELRDNITTLWTNFAATGNPTPDDSLGFIWEPSTEDEFHYLALKPSPTMEPDQRQEVRRFQQSLPTEMNLALQPELVQKGPAAE